MASAEPSSSQIFLSPSAASSETALTPTTDAVPRFRILLVGRSGVGKSSLVNAVFKVPDLDGPAKVEHERAGKADVAQAISSDHNQEIILHDSEGYEPGDEHKFNTLKKFIAEQASKDVADRIHAIWLCIQVPFASARVETGDQRILELKPDKVPIIAVFTKYDVLVSNADIELRSTYDENESEDMFQQKCHEQATKDFEMKCLQQFPEGISCIPVSNKIPGTLEKLVQTTIQQIKALDPPERQVVAPCTQHTGSPVRRSWGKKLKDRLLPGSYRHVQYPKPDTVQPGSTQAGGLSDSARAGTAFAMAQRVDMPSKIKASIEIGKNKYWRGITSGIGFADRTMKTCSTVIHTDIIRIWNIPDLNEFFLSHTFCGRMTHIVDDLWTNKDGNLTAMGKAVTAGVGVGGLAAAVSGPAAPIAGPVVAAGVFFAVWAFQAYQTSRENVRCLMGYVVDLTLIMKDVFQESLKHKDGKVTKERVEEIIDVFDKSQKKISVHTEIQAFSLTMNLFAKDAAVDQIEALINDS
ncbi:hypothetical protein AX14_010969 [Amanita brunnescens Koide BX004]|nr:hypothetical protein AX14_010969 [Amanita brunnescens Koide BX004]